MEQDVILECKNHFHDIPKHKVGSTYVPNSRKAQEKDRKGQPTKRYYHLNSLDGDLRELSRSYSSGLHYERMFSKTLGDLGKQEVLKRGSMYQSSKEVIRMRKVREGRRKIDSTCSDDAFLSFEIVDDLPHLGSNDAVLFSHQKRTPLFSLNAESKPSSISTNKSIMTRSNDFLDLSFRDLPDKHLRANTSELISEANASTDDFLEISLETNSKCNQTKRAPQLLEAECTKEEKSDCNQKIGPGSFGTTINERDSLHSLHELFSTKGRISSVASQLEYGSLNASPKTWFSPLKKMLRSSSLVVTETAGITTMGSRGTRNGVSCKYLLNDFSRSREMGSDVCLIEEVMTTASSPAHLHGFLRLETENGSTSFEFSVKDPEEVISAKTWRADNAFNWVYTFHSFRKKVTNNDRRAKDKHGHSLLMVGQMQVSCYLCSEVRENGSLANSAVTEFVSYDIAQARRSSAADERSLCSSDFEQPLTSKVMECEVAEEPQERNNSIERLNSGRHASSSAETDTSTSYPWPTADLHAHQEVAAVVIQTPFNKNNSKDMKEVSLKENKSLSSYPPVGQVRDTFCNNLDPAIIKVVTPSGTHGLPNNNEVGPSTLLGRWRFGGGCDCGGWDMACPIFVFDNPHAYNYEDCLPLESQKPMLLFLQGSKEKLPALSMKAEGKGQYAVDFHARFSVLQAFSICIAILHSSVASSVVNEEKNRQRMYSSSLKLLLEEEVRHLIEAVAVEEKPKAKKKEEQTQSFFLDPPFSPMGRV